MAGHGWLINHSLSPLFNKTNRQNTAATANRARFAIEVLESVRRAVGAGFPLNFE